MDISITLTSNVKKTDTGTVSLSFRAIGYNIDGAVFAIEVLPRDVDPSMPNYRFSHVCSPAELVEFPRDVPGDCCYFRVDSIELLFDDASMVEHVIGNMRSDIARLVKAYRELDNTQGTTIVEEF